MQSDRSVDADCLFCKIIAGEIPCARVYEDDSVLAFLDIQPAAKGHVLVVPKGHYATLLEFPDSQSRPLLRALRLVAGAVREETGCDGFNCVQNNFAAAGQTVFHTHWHVVPRFTEDGLLDWPGGQYADNDEMRRLAQSISHRLANTLAGGTHER